MNLDALHMTVRSLMRDGRAATVELSDSETRALRAFTRRLASVDGAIDRLAPPEGSPAWLAKSSIVAAV